MNSFFSPELSEEERASILAAPEFIDFVEQSSKIVQRALNDGYDSAVCTGHERSQIENCGAHYVVENMDHVTYEVEGDCLKFSVWI